MVGEDRGVEMGGEGRRDSDKEGIEGRRGEEKRGAGEDVSRRVVVERAAGMKRVLVGQRQLKKEACP